VNPIEIHIEELVLEGVAPGDRHRVAEAFAQELARLTAEQGFPRGRAAGQTVDRLDAGTLPRGLHTGAPDLGTEIATAVHRNLSARHER
jgi:hypothetical protein